ncbi:LysR family transcriptional regulator [Allopusillimonas soli]|uniref:LysR family transcriptional regulator n=1 Tax=Allopusillimonas soli TaxID=659016 RepID=A0A853F6I2_9BURK|nr:LysR family transcriptional regulator [Allopusillimonas soli]NYT35448.1 LysR family transcriptional regulator [Allopusillimonas soli]TEA75863.1 LysR family transcriptional regulator [Allopusillimonas soli]
MIRELNTLIAVAREGTFAAAGHKTGLTQAAVSAQMRRLENELGFTLFDRIGRAARLNETGRQVLAQAQELIQMYNNLGASPVGSPSGKLINIGAIASLQRTLLPDALAKFHQQCPGCRTRIMPGLSVALVNLVDAGELDMAAVIRPPFALQGDLRWTPLAHEPFRLIVPRKVCGSDWARLLSNQPFIRYDRSSFGGRQVDRFLRDMHIKPREVCEADELEAIVRLVANGVGVALAPQTAIHRRWPAALRAIDLGDHTFHRDVGLVHRPDEHLNDSVKLLTQIISAVSQREPAPRENNRMRHPS